MLIILGVVMLESLKAKLMKRPKSGKIGNNEKKYFDFLKSISARTDKPFKFVIYSDDVKGAARPRHRIFKKGNAVFSTTYDPASNKIFKSLIKNEILAVLSKNHQLLEESLSLKMEIYKKMPKNFSLLKKVLAEEKLIVPCKKPDLDNYAKLPMDAMNQIIYEDDVYVTKLSIDKYYSLIPRLVIIINIDKGNMCG